MDSEIYKEINIKCAERGISISQMCRELNIERMKIQRWKNSPPNSVVDYKKIMDYFKNGGDENSGAHNSQKR